MKRRKITVQYTPEELLELKRLVFEFKAALCVHLKKLISIEEYLKMHYFLSIQTQHQMQGFILNPNANTQLD